jgi:hypothetical protein
VPDNRVGSDRLFDLVDLPRIVADMRCMDLAGLL